jgi:hypothetical protein
MSKIEIFDITRKQLDEGILPPNQVLVESEITLEGAKTKGGIVVGFLEDTTFAEGDNALCADVCIPYGRVYRAPQKLYFNPKDEASMPWDTEVEVQKGDMIWFSIMESYNAVTFRVDGKYFKLIPYADSYVAKRIGKIWRGMGGATGEDIVIPLNGYVLCEPMNLQKISDLDFISEDKIDTTKARVKYFGTPNRRYKDSTAVDFQDLRRDDVVLLAKGTPLMYLERKKYFAQFDGDNLYWVLQRRKIMAVINR